MYVARLDRVLNVNSIMIVEVFSHMPVNNVVVRLRIGRGYCSASGTAAAVASGLNCDTKPNHHLISGLNRTAGPDIVTMGIEWYGKASKNTLT